MRGTRGVKAGESGSYGTLCMIDLRNVLRELLHPGKRYRLLPKSRRFRREGPRRLKNPRDRSRCAPMRYSVLSTSTGTSGSR
jgi:hypothetical protein